MTKENFLNLCYDFRELLYKRKEQVLKREDLEQQNNKLENENKGIDLKIQYYDYCISQIDDLQQTLSKNRKSMLINISLKYLIPCIILLTLIPINIMFLGVSVAFFLLNVKPIIKTIIKYSNNINKQLLNHYNDEVKQLEFFVLCDKKKKSLNIEASSNNNIRIAMCIIEEKKIQEELNKLIYKLSGNPKIKSMFEEILRNEITNENVYEEDVQKTKR